MAAHTTFCCTHVRCTQTEVGQERHTYSCMAMKNKHERREEYHNCAMGCSACQRWAGKMVRRKRKATVPCRHDHCQKMFADEKGRNEHEEMVGHHCSRSCAECTQQRAKRERREHKEEERKRKKRAQEEEVERMCEMNEKVMQATKKKCEEDLREQAQANDDISIEEHRHAVCAAFLQEYYQTSMVVISTPSNKFYIYTNVCYIRSIVSTN